MNILRSTRLALTVAALGAAFVQSPAVLPTRRRDFEAGYDMNTGKHYKDKSDFRKRLDAVCRAQAPGANHV